jgi:hypothetical protein
MHLDQSTGSFVCRRLAKFPTSYDDAVDSNCAAERALFGDVSRSRVYNQHQLSLILKQLKSVPPTSVTPSHPQRFFSAQIKKIEKRNIKWQNKEQ